VPRELQADEDEGRYARACEIWMSQIRAIAARSHTGNIFKASVEAGYGKLARDDENQIVVVSPEQNYSTVVDRSLLGTFDPLAFHRWVSSIDRKQLPTKFEVREGQEHSVDPELETVLKSLHARQAEHALSLTQSRDSFDERVTTRVPDIFEIHMKNRRQQSAEFEWERERYIEEHREASRIAEQLKEEEKQKTLGRDLGSKFYR